MNRTLYNSRVPARPLRASGNLSYLDFIRMVEQVWSESHPDIPFIAAGLSVDSKYPSIVYSIANRVPHPNEPKPRQRELPIQEDDSEDMLIIYAQRFVNFVKFTVVDRVEPNGAQVAEELIEVFEDFMQTYMDLFKQKGLSDISYERRLGDDEEARQGEGVVTRQVVYRVTTEKIIHVRESLLKSVWTNISIAGGYEPTECEDGPTVYPIGTNLLETED